MAPSALSYHPDAPGPSRPTDEREQKAEQHLEGRTDNRHELHGKRRNYNSGLDGESRFTEGVSIAPVGVGRGISRRTKGPLQLYTWIPDPDPHRDLEAEGRVREFLTEGAPSGLE